MLIPSLPVCLADGTAVRLVRMSEPETRLAGLVRSSRGAELLFYFTLDGEPIEAAIPRLENIRDVMTFKTTRFRERDRVKWQGRTGIVRCSNKAGNFPILVEFYDEPGVLYDFDPDGARYDIDELLELIKPGWD